MHKLKVAHVITRMIVGGAQENTLFTVEGLAKDTLMDVTLISGPQTGPEGNLLEKVDFTEVNYEIKYVSQLVRQINPFLDVMCLIRLYVLFKKEKYDVVHTHSSKAGIIGRIAAFLSGTNVIVHTIHGLPFHPYQNKLVNWIYIGLEKLTALCSHKILTVCSVMAEKALSAGVAKKEKFKTVYSGTDLDVFLQAKQNREVYRKKYQIADEDIVIGKIARLFYLKGHEYVIEAAKKIVKRIPQVKFVFVGNGILRDKYEEEIRKLGMSDYFVFAGLVDPSEIPNMISMFDLVVHCSLREGLARVIPYALAEGIPVVSFDIDGACEVVHDFETGFLVEPENVPMLEDKILSVLENKELYDKMSAAGPAVVDPIFRKEYMVSEIKKVYDELLKK